MREEQPVRVLIVDDEPNITSFLQMGLEEQGFQTDICHHGLQAVRQADTFHPDVVILDVMMPGMDGYEVCMQLKKKGNPVIIMLTAKDDIDDRVKGLDLGADDYVVKPFSFRELLSRIRARLRDAQRTGMQVVTGTFEAGPFLVQDERHEISYRGKALVLSPTEYGLLRYFIVNRGIVLSKALILEKVWGYDFMGDENIVEVYVRYLREKLTDKERTLIRTIRGTGYRMDI